MAHTEKTIASQTLFEGRITGDFASGGITKEEIGYYMTGGKAKEAAK